METQHFCLKWNDFRSNMANSFIDLLQDEDFVDVTISCDGRMMKAHKMVLSASSTYFRDLLKNNPCQHPIIILRDVEYWQLELLLLFMYNGEINVAHNNLSGLLKTAESLKIKGLMGDRNNTKSPDFAGEELHRSSDDSIITASSERKRKRLNVSRIDSDLSIGPNNKVSKDEIDSIPFKNDSSYNQDYDDEIPTPSSSNVNVLTKIEPVEYFESSNSFDYNEDQVSLKPRTPQVIPGDETLIQTSNAPGVGMSLMSSLNESPSTQGGLPQECPYCQRQLGVSELVRHVFEFHSTSGKKLLCEICFRLYSTKNSLRKHRSVTHRHCFNHHVFDREQLSSDVQRRATQMDFN